MKKINLPGYAKSDFASQRVALISKIEGTFKILSAFSNCRGWMSDAIHNYKMGHGYGYKFSSTFHREDFDIKKGFTYIGITFGDQSMKSIFLNQLNTLHSKESLGKIKKTVLYETQDPLMLIAEGSRFWKDSCWKIQLYTFYLRCMCYKDMNYYGDTWRKLNYKNNELILLSKIKDQNESFEGVESIHGCTGPDAICDGRGNKVMTKILGVNVP